MKPFTQSLLGGHIEQSAWEKLVSDYVSEEIFPRGPLDIISSPGVTDAYAWELEKEVTQLFVDQVRRGEHEAAKDNGIPDFIWISVIDNVTDECCKWRDGLTVTEIETQLKGKHSNDKCQTIVPPAHFNCRCALAPLTDDLPSSPPPDLGDFEDWLS